VKLTVFQRAGDPAFEPIHAVFTAPGGTVGRSLDNQLALPDPTRGICRVQAAIRVNDDDAGFLLNLSDMSTVSVNGQALARRSATTGCAPQRPRPRLRRPARPPWSTTTSSAT
jgi:FHA domain-containing protein